MNLKVNVNSTSAGGTADLNLLKFDCQKEVDKRFVDLRLDGLSIIESHLVRCVFNRVNARSASFGSGQKQSLLEDCTFEDCHLLFSAIGNVRLERCTFKSCQLENIFGTHLELIGCVFQETKIKKAVFYGKPTSVAGLRSARTANEFVGNDFSSADLMDVDFRGGLDLEAQRVPDGDEYLFIPDTCYALEVGKELQKAVTGSVEIRRCHQLLALLELSCSAGQRSQLFRTDSWSKFEKDLKCRVQI